jgi:hypothetical protein
MNSEVSINGKEITEFVKNTDYFEMSDGVFWTINALMRKYDIGHSTVYNKARDFKIPGMKILGTQCYKESDKFNKIKSNAGNTESLKGYQITTYAELHRKIEELIATVKSATVPEMYISEDVKNLSLLMRNQEERLFVLKDIVLNIKESVDNILDEMTKEKKDD